MRKRPKPSNNYDDEPDSPGIEAPAFERNDVRRAAMNLLARLPTRNPLKWRVGHYRRRIPQGYMNSVGQNNQLVDPSLRTIFSS